MFIVMYDKPQNFHHYVGFKMDKLRLMSTNGANIRIWLKSRMSLLGVANTFIPLDTAILHQPTVYLMFHDPQSWYIVGRTLNVVTSMPLILFAYSINSCTLCREIIETVIAQCRIWQNWFRKVCYCSRSLAQERLKRDRNNDQMQNRILIYQNYPVAKIAWQIVTFWIRIRFIARFRNGDAFLAAGTGIDFLVWMYIGHLLS